MTDQAIIELADNLDCGLRCFVHKGEKKIMTVPDIHEYDDNYEYWNKVLKEIKDQYIEIERMNSNESFRLMTNFIETIGDLRLKSRLEGALNNPKPFRNFRFEIDQSGPFLQKWFDFRRRQMIEWVKAQLLVNNL